MLCLRVWPALLLEMLFAHGQDDLGLLGGTTPEGSAVILRGQHEAVGDIEIPCQGPIEQEILGTYFFHLAHHVAVDAHDLHPDMDQLRAKRVGFEDLALFGRVCVTHLVVSVRLSPRGHHRVTLYVWGGATLTMPRTVVPWSVTMSMISAAPLRPGSWFCSTSGDS